MNPENRVEFTKEMKDYTLLAPNMADVHFSILCNVFGQYGYKVELLKNDGILPLSKTIKSIAVIGPNADKAYNQLGDYTAFQDQEEIITPLEGIKK